MTATDDHTVVDRRRVELLERGLPAAPIHHKGGSHELHRSGDLLDDDALVALVAEVRESAVRRASAELDQLEQDLPSPIVSMSLRAWPDDFPNDIAVQRVPPYESRVDSIMYRQVLAEIGRMRGWKIHLYDKGVEEDAAHVLGDDADEVLRGPRRRLGPPWSKDHRMALAATIVAG